MPDLISKVRHAEESIRAELDFPNLICTLSNLHEAKLKLACRKHLWHCLSPVFLTGIAEIWYTKAGFNKESLWQGLT